MRTCFLRVQKTLSSHVLLSSILPRSNRTTLQHRSIEFLTTQTDQSKGDILIDYVLRIFDLSLPVGDKFFQSDGKWNCQLVIGLGQDLQMII